MNPRLKHLIFDNPLIISFLLLAVVFTCWANVAGLMTTEFLFPAVGAVLGLSYFILKQHLEETRLFKELFTEFNDRYDKKNEGLYKILREPNQTPLEPDDIMVLYDYFNLCAEEYLFYRKGFIHPTVWRAWMNGMKIFYADARVRAEWQKELKTNSYYGFKAKWLEAQLSRKIESLEDSANLPDPDIIAAEIVEDLQAALAQFAEIANDLKK